MNHSRSRWLNRAGVAAAAAATALLAGACSSGGHATAGTTSTTGPAAASSAAAAPASGAVRTVGGVQVVTVHTTDGLRFSPADITVHVGKVRIDLVDDGSYPHNLSVPALRRTSGTVSGTPGEQSTSVAFTFASPGVYPFVCTYHASAGMTGKITVTG